MVLFLYLPPSKLYSYINININQFSMILKPFKSAIKNFYLSSCIHPEPGWCSIHGIERERRRTSRSRTKTKSRRTTFFGIMWLKKFHEMAIVVRSNHFYIQLKCVQWCCCYSKSSTAIVTCWFFGELREFRRNYSIIENWSMEKWEWYIHNFDIEHCLLINNTIRDMCMWNRYWSGTQYQRNITSYRMKWFIFCLFDCLLNTSLYSSLCSAFSQSAYEYDIWWLASKFCYRNFDDWL